MFFIALPVHTFSSLFTLVWIVNTEATNIIIVHYWNVKKIYHNQESYKWFSVQTSVKLLHVGTKSHPYLMCIIYEEWDFGLMRRHSPWEYPEWHPKTRNWSMVNIFCCFSQSQLVWTEKKKNLGWDIITCCFITFHVVTSLHS